MKEDQIQQIRKKKCQFCGKRINIGNYQLHLTRCHRKNIKQTNNDRQKHPKQDLSAKIQRPLKIEGQNKKQDHRIQKSEQKNNQERIPCYLCGYQQTLYDLDFHHLLCPNRQMNCGFCKQKFPQNIILDHKKVCTKNYSKIFNQPFPKARDIFSYFKNKQSNKPKLSVPITTNQPYKASQYVNLQKQQEDNQKKSKKEQINDIIHNTQLVWKRSNESINIMSRKSQERQRVTSNNIQNSFRSPLECYLWHRNRIQQLANRHLVKKDQGIPNYLIRLIPQKIFTPNDLLQCQCCSICCVQFQKNDNLKDLKCNHDFHSKCISDWLKINSSCPLCKSDLSVNIPKTQKEDTSEKQVSVSPKRRAQNLIKSLYRDEQEGQSYSY